MSLARRVSAEFAGTGLLVAVVIGSGITADRLSPHDTGLQLLENPSTNHASSGSMAPALASAERSGPSPRLPGPSTLMD